MIKLLKLRSGLVEVTKTHVYCWVSSFSGLSLKLNVTCHAVNRNPSHLINDNLMKLLYILKNILCYHKWT